MKDLDSIPAPAALQNFPYVLIHCGVNYHNYENQQDLILVVFFRSSDIDVSKEWYFIPNAEGLIQPTTAKFTIYNIKSSNQSINIYGDKSFKATARMTPN